MKPNRRSVFVFLHMQGPILRVGNLIMGQQKHQIFIFI